MRGGRAWTRRARGRRAGSAAASGLLHAGGGERGRRGRRRAGERGRRRHGTKISKSQYVLKIAKTVNETKSDLHVESSEVPEVPIAANHDLEEATVNASSLDNT